MKLNRPKRSKNRLLLAWLLLVVAVFSSCKNEVNIQSLDTTAQVDFALALPMGTINVTIGDLLGTTSQPSDNLYYRADGTLALQGEMHFREDFHHINIADYISSVEHDIPVGSYLLSAMDALKGTLPPGLIPDNTVMGIPGHAITLPLEADFSMHLSGINNDLSSERIDSILVTNASFQAYLESHNLPFDFSWIDTIRLAFGDQIRYSGQKDFLLYDKATQGGQVDFGSTMDVALDRFVLDLVKDHSQEMTIHNVLDSIGLKAHIVLTIPEDAAPFTISSDMALAFGLRAQFIEYDKVFGMVRASNKMTYADEMDIAKAIPNWHLFQSMRLPLAEPSIHMVATHRLAGPIYIQGNSLYTVSQDGAKHFATFGPERSQSVRYPKDLATNPSSWLHPQTSAITDSAVIIVDFDHTEDGGRIDEMFRQMPQRIGWDFSVGVDSSLVSQMRLTTNTMVSLDARIDVPLVFHEGMYITYADTIANVSLNSLSLSSLQQSNIDSVAIEQLTLRLKIENGLPVATKLVLHCLDEYGNRLYDASGRELHLGAIDTISIAAPSYDVVGGSLAMTKKGETTQYLDIDPSDMAQYDKIKSIVFELVLDNASLQPVFDANPDFRTRIKQSDALSIGIAIGTKVGVSLDLQNEQ